MKGTKLIIFSLITITVLLGFNIKAEASHSNTNLQQLINNAEPGEIIELEAEEYDGPVFIDKPLTIVGDDNSVIMGTNEEPAVTISSEDVAIKGVTIRQSINIDVNAYEPAILLTDADRFNLMNSHIESLGSAVLGTDSVDIHIEDNEFVGMDVENIFKGLAAVELYKSNQAFISNNKINNVTDGIYVHSISDAQINNNEVTHSRYGVHVMFSSNISGSSNTFNHNINGLMIMDSSDITFSNNDLSDQYNWNGFGVMMYRSQDVTLETNEINRNVVGVYIEDTDRINLQGNTVLGNQIGLVWEKENRDLSLSRNSFISNILTTLGDSTTELFLDNGEVGNYWSSHTAMDVDSDGLSELPHTVTNFYTGLISHKKEFQLFFESPSLSLISSISNWYPGEVGGVIDRFPLSQPHTQLGKNDNSFAVSVGYLSIAVILLCVPTVLIFYFRKKGY